LEPNALQAEQITAALKAALEPLDFVKAAWQAGAAAFDRLDQWSDIDLMIVVDDERVEQTFQALEETLMALSPIDLSFRIPQPTWHGHDQAIYRLKEAGPFLLVDAAVMKLSSRDKFLQPELHGQARVFFDKAGVVQPPEFDWEAHRGVLAGRLETLKVVFELFQTLTLKELERGCLLDALGYYHSYTLRPLVELLRVRHDPARYNFGLRYLYYDLPPGEASRLEALYLVGSGDDLRARHAEAGRWFRELVEQETPP
jgi:hypothetical protein